MAVSRNTFCALASAEGLPLGKRQYLVGLFSTFFVLLRDENDSSGDWVTRIKNNNKIKFLLTVLKNMI